MGGVTEIRGCPLVLDEALANKHVVGVRLPNGDLYQIACSGPPTGRREVAIERMRDLLARKLSGPPRVGMKNRQEWLEKAQAGWGHVEGYDAIDRLCCLLEMHKARNQDWLAAVNASSAYGQKISRLQVQVSELRERIAVLELEKEQWTSKT